MPSRLLRCLMAAAVLAALLELVSASPSYAGLAKPSHLTPTHSTGVGQPVLGWTRVKGAQRYEVQVASSSDFSALLYDVSTTNQRATPTQTLPRGKLFWRVRGISDVKGTRSSWATTWFSRSALPAPVLRAPATGATLVQPAEPPRLLWKPTTGAVSYTVQVDTDSDFVQPYERTTGTESFVYPLAEPGQPFHWRVRANFFDGFTSGWSAERTFSVEGLANPTLRAPVDDASVSVTDAVLDWNPVPGAAWYEFRVSTDDQFKTLVDSGIVRSTRYANPRTYNNDQYWWQVRAIDAHHNASPWDESPRWQFQRAWTERPTLVYPANNDNNVPNPFFYEWTPVPHASLYRLDVGTDPNFSPGTFASCETRQTTYTPRSDNTGCAPTAATLLYWRVRAFDDPSGAGTLPSTPRSFVYNKRIVTQVLPLDADTVDVPTLTWEAPDDAVAYEVVVKSSSGAVVASTQTNSTSWTPPARLDPAVGPFHWTVASIDGDGQHSPIPIFGFDRTFSLTGDTPDTSLSALAPLTPSAGDHSTRFPSLSWEPMFVDGTPAHHYQVWVAPAASPAVNNIGTFAYNAATDAGPTSFSPGTYRWFVQAFDADNHLLASGPQSTFVIDDLMTVDGQRVALTGTGSEDPAKSCSVSLDAASGPTVCGNLQQTPVFRWEPVDKAGYYMVYLSNDKSMTNLVRAPVVTQNTVWQPTGTLPESQAGAAYYWFVRPCKVNGYCAPDPQQAGNAFDKRSNPVGGLREYQHDSATPLPAHGPAGADDPTTFADELVLTWDDYLTTSLAGNAQDSTHAAATVEARTYHLQIATDPNFSNVVVDDTVDQTSYTPAGHTLPEGPVFWRVQALDPDLNPLTWSLPRTAGLEKSSPRPASMSPTSGASASGNVSFGWQPLAFAASYEIQVARRNDRTFAPANLVVDERVDYPVYSLSSPLMPQGPAYVWRVRRFDADGLAGRWSSPSSFVVKGQGPRQSSPSTGAKISMANARFSWQSVSSAAYYVVQRRLRNESALQESVTTIGLSWAPPYLLARGSYQWRVSAYDRANGLLGSSSWRSVSVH